MRICLIVVPSYHWALIVGPKIETPGKIGMRYHAKELPKAGGGSEWYFDGSKCQLTPTSMLLVRVMIGKVEDGNSLAQILSTTPIRQNKVGWNCVAWVREALERLKADGKALGTSVIDWEAVRNESMSYCQRKKD